MTPYGLASEALSSPRYNAASYVKGPVWAPPNTFISEGLASLGQRDLAVQIRRNFCKACLKGGMSENFDAGTGSPQHDPTYNWTAAMYLWLASSGDRVMPS
jgi:glycogen debranching enzyme